MSGSWSLFSFFFLLLFSFIFTADLACNTVHVLSWPFMAPFFRSVRSWKKQNQFPHLHIWSGCGSPPRCAIIFWQWWSQVNSFTVRIHWSAPQPIGWSVFQIQVFQQTRSWAVDHQINSTWIGPAVNGLNFDQSVLYWLTFDPSMASFRVVLEETEPRLEAALSDWGKGSVSYKSRLDSS